MYRGVTGYGVREVESGPFVLHELNQAPCEYRPAIAASASAPEPTASRLKVGSGHSSMHCGR